MSTTSENGPPNVEPPANIAIPNFGRDAAAGKARATLKVALLQVPKIEEKMSTPLKTTDNA